MSSKDSSSRRDEEEEEKAEEYDETRLAARSSSSSSLSSSEDDEEEESDQDFDYPALSNEYKVRKENLTKAELNAIDKLGRQGHLFYAHPLECCPFRGLAKALHRQLIENDEYSHIQEGSWYVKEYLEEKLAKNPSRDVGRGEHTETEKLWLAAADEIRCHIGDDVIAGTLYPTSITNNNTNNNNSADDTSEKQQQQQQRQPLTSFTFKARNEEFQVPLTWEQCIKLYNGGSPSMFGKEGVGDVYDDAVRCSMEFPADQLQLPEFLANPEKYFPEMTENVTARLVPTSETVKFVPYKLVAYRPGDFFSHHRDTVYDETHTATLAIHLPCRGDYEEKVPAEGFKESPENYSYEGEDDESSAPKTIAPADKWKYPNANEPMPDAGKLPNTRCVGGALRFFLGRDLVFSEYSYNSDVMRSETEYATYGRMNSTSDMMVAAIRLQNYTNSELTLGQSAPIPAHANKLAEWRDHDAEVEFRKTRNQKAVVKKAGRVGLDDPAERKFTPLHYACWTTSTVHDVRPLKSGYRFVMTYKVLRVGNEVWRVPPVIGFNKLLGDFVKSYYINCVKNGEYQPRDAPEGSIVAKPKFPAFAFLCRHTYAPYTLTPAALRRIDATTYYALTAKWEVILTPVLVLRRAVQAVPWGLAGSCDGATARVDLFLTAEFAADATDPAVRDVHWTSESTDEEFHMRLPRILIAGCMELGFGDLFREGRSYGNGDCSASFYYRSAAMICTFKPSEWARRKIAFWILEKSKDDNMNVMKKISHLYPVFRNIVLFL